MSLADEAERLQAMLGKLLGSSTSYPCNALRGQGPVANAVVYSLSSRLGARLGYPSLNL